MKQSTVKRTEWQGREFNKETGKLEDVYKEVEYKVGDAATILYYSDRSPATIIEISEDGRTVKVQEDKATRIDTNGMSDCQDYEYERDPQGSVHTFKLNRRGDFTDNGKVDYGTKLGFGWREKYFDYSF